MSASLYLGKTRGLRRLADEAGHFTMVAVDQRPPIAQLVASRRGIPTSDVSFADMVSVKRLLVDALHGPASAMLLDPNYAFPAALRQLPARTGLVVTLEDHRFTDTAGGRLSHSIRDWSVDKIKRTGADAVKVLAWYRPDAAADVREHQQAYVRRVGEECRRWDIPFVLELLVYPFASEAGRAGHADYVEDPSKQPALVIDSLREFARPEYGVDLFKLEAPWPGATLPDPDGSPSHRAVQRDFDALGELCRSARGGAGVPWVMLSAGVTAAQFSRVMRHAYAAGANGFLAGRAIWWQPLQAFPDLRACGDALRDQGLRTLHDLNALTRERATAWQADGPALDGFDAEGQVCAAYT